MNNQLKQGILLESGTNELEVLELGIDGKNCFGINVAKVREITSPVRVTKLPKHHPYIEGLIQLRDEILPVINLSLALGLPWENEDTGVFVVTEFNQMKVIFHVSWVNQIHRVSWEEIEKPSQMFQTMEGSLIGVIKKMDKIILLLDFEKILVDINPSVGITKERVQKTGSKEERATKRILIAEDSWILRKLIEETLIEAGYKQLSFFQDGQQAWDHLEEIYQKDKNQLKKYVELVITDIEMPRMDGLHFTKRIKEHEVFKELPVIIFSSLISDSLRHKGEQVGANAQITKPEIDKLVETMDRLIV
ncbi:chemotaxis protein CheV [Ammoniphilus sp. YIM 78166]|uniref:chemotaxis protein CheV n=1 Tax=Ammoniphilus sp. YIM 78166 TaxID=1644106 RepID=UPI00107013EB|nr:chemotaxis protein [Ammoniphilus sp. YIM 78166]